MQTQFEPEGVIHPDRLYTLKAFTRSLGIRAATLRAARRAGLRVYYVHKHAYILGRDWIEYVVGASKPTGTTGPQTNPPETDPTGTKRGRSSGGDRS